MKYNASNWIHEDNLEPLLIELSLIAGYKFNDLDYDAIFAGIKPINSKCDIKYEYELHGKIFICIIIAQESGTSVYDIEIKTDSPILERIQYLLSICQNWHLRK